jgi:hypothetical protein
MLLRPQNEAANGLAAFLRGVIAHRMKVDSGLLPLPDWEEIDVAYHPNRPC